MEKHILSKSTFIRGLQCPKSLMLNKLNPELRDKLSESQKQIFTRGTNVGIFARDIFPGGIDASPETPFQYQESVLLTDKLIKEKTGIIYEAASQYERVLCAIDILVKDKRKWNAYEVKSSTEVKDIYIMDSSLQYYVMVNAGIKLKDFSIVFINNQYIRHGDIDIHQLFSIQSIYNEVRENYNTVHENILCLKDIINRGVVPEKNIGPHCKDPYDCDFMGHCWKHVPDNSVFDISRLTNDKKFYLYNRGIISLNDVPESYPLNDGQRLQVECHRTNKKHIDIEGIREFLQTITYPVYFMDFETFMPAIPLYDNSRPYQQITFQYSLHFLDAPDGNLIHHEFLAYPGEDPRIPFINNLLHDTNKPGDILVYNKAFEITRLKEIAIDFPEFAEDIEKLISRIKDLMLPFQKKYIYFPKMNGSYSIKSVLPALIPDLAYDNLEISDGGMAMSAYEQLCNSSDEEEKNQIRKALLEYCKLDTYAMVRILKWFEGYIKSIINN